VAELLRDHASRSTSRRELEARHEQFAEVSADVGELDAEALAGALEQDPDGAVELLAGMARATDRQLRERARRLAAELLVPVARHGADRARRGATRLTTSAKGGLELDIDATVERLAARPVPGADDLRWRTWRRPGRAYVLLVDASGSVTGRPLATAVVTAAALAARLRPGDELGVVAFWSKAVVLRPVTSPEPPGAVLDALFDLRGGDTTDLAGGLAAALQQAGRARAARREVLVLTDAMANAGQDPVAVAATAEASGSRLHVLGLSGDDEARRRGVALAGAGGGRYVSLLRTRDAVPAVAEVLEE
jgi:Mg-chelatase subunit ChlD